MQFSVADAKNKLPELIRAVESGQSVTICRRGRPVVDMVPTRTPSGRAPIFGSLRDQVKIFDPDWWKPMSDEEVEEMLGGDE